MKHIFPAVVLAAILTGSTVFSSCENKRETKSETTEKSPDQAKENVVATPETLNPEDVTADAAPLDSASANTSALPAKTTGLKFGHINSADLVEMMPETKKAEAALAAYVKTLEGQFSGMQNDYQKRVTDFQAQEKGMLPNVKENKIRDIQELELKLQETQMASREKVADKREQLFKPILLKAEKAVQEVSKENNYDYVFDTNAGSFIYSRESYDIMPLVKKKLNLK